jgi:hypothetical protein
MRNGICYAALCPLAIPCFQRNNGSCCHHLIPSQKLEKLVFMLRFAGVAKAHWHGCMFDQLHQRDHSKRTFFTARIAGVSVSGLINRQDVLAAKFHELEIIYKDVLDGSNWQNAKMVTDWMDGKHGMFRVGT